MGPRSPEIQTSRSQNPDLEVQKSRPPTGRWVLGPFLGSVVGPKGGPRRPPKGVEKCPKRVQKGSKKGLKGVQKGVQKGFKKGPKRVQKGSKVICTPGFSLVENDRCHWLHVASVCFRLALQVLAVHSCAEVLLCIPNRIKHKLIFLGMWDACLWRAHVSRWYGKLRGSLVFHFCCVGRPRCCGRAYN